MFKIHIISVEPTDNVFFRIKLDLCPLQHSIYMYIC